MNWETLDWEVLDRLRETFLTDAKSAGPYWQTMTDLETYDLTYGERIGWKWDAVLRELRLRGWSPPTGGTLLDWGCGSGVPGRRVVDFFGAENFSRLLVHDHSELALNFATHRATETFPGLSVERAAGRDLRGDAPIDVLVVSHVVNELDEAGRADFAALVARAATVLWVEPGTSEVSRELVGWREKLGADFRVVAPCTHQSACGLLAPTNERHWCHHFASPPSEIFANSDWVRFGQRAGIDLRSLPYSFLVLDRRVDVEPLPTGVSRILGEPRHYKGYAKLYNCSASGVEELTLQQRVDKALFKTLKRARGPLLYSWARKGDQIIGATPAFAATSSEAAPDVPVSGTE